MAKLFVFGIGGTGSRVLRSLSMLLASGVNVSDEIVPVIIDPDAANADLTRTVALLNYYLSIRSHLTFTGGDESKFFRTEIRKVLPNFTLRLTSTNDKSFSAFIGYSSMNRANQAISRMLFSDRNLESSMQVGFKGNPNIGSVVLNQIVDSPDFQDVANYFTAGDRIFIISSIFGGTGASGFPLLLKTLRTGTDFPNFSLINNAVIGGVSILPYFNLKKDEKSEIDSSTFISKAKSALAYYEKNISNNNSLDALYYLADNIVNTYENHEGGSTQQNAAHLIEFLAATAIVDFANRFKTRNSNSTSNLELGIKDTDGAVTFAALYPGLRSMLYYPMVQFVLMANALTHNLGYYSSGTFAANSSNFNNLYNGMFFRDLTDFFELYHQWLAELKENKRALNLFNASCGEKPFELVTGVTPRKIFSMHSDYDLYTSRLNSAIRSCRSKSTEDKFMEMFYLATRRLVDEKLSN